jgi:demethylmenaquinone methyltransferase/2-methoxy-6-polyprenyl-1,4-benzoquinol methylase
MSRKTDESLSRAFESQDTKRRYVRWLFATIADRYDTTTRVLSFGLDRKWKQRLVALAGVRPGSRALDLACGTGDIALEVARQGASVIGLDITMRMLEIARQKPLPGRVSWLVGDMMALPVISGSCDLVTTGYGLRNVPDLPQTLREIYRVLKPGGLACSLDFDRPEAAWLRGVYLTFLTLFGGPLGWILHRRSETYRYIPASISRYPGAAGVVRLMRETGFTDVRHVPVLGGLMAIHMFRKRT